MANHRMSAAAPATPTAPPVPAGAAPASRAAHLQPMQGWKLVFATVALAVALIGITSYLFLYLRSGQHPILNEAQPDNWQSLLDVIRRKQYPPRTPFDDPTVLSGPGNPGRSGRIIFVQIVNYLQYFSWQWGLGLGLTNWKAIAPSSGLSIQWSHSRRYQTPPAMMIGTESDTPSVRIVSRSALTRG